ncbi:dihydrodipicolinate synthase family protein [Actinoplanes sp. NPDC024001]|uniref:dihydrodipicolinate synthase family protein n=1 Tax=Actinoplanes sp. NPDC024001 TaxID=3154598 RepID=UPI0033E25437
MSLTGIIPPVVTPLTADGDVDVASLERLVGFLLDGGVSGLFALGSSGEVAYLTDQQRDQILDVIVRTAAGQVPVIAGAIETTTNRVIERGHAAVKAGADALVATAPFYVRTHPTEIDRHFRAVRAAVDLPLLAYDVPVAVQVKLDPAQIVELARDGVLAGLKDSSGDDVSFRRIVLGTRDIPGFSALTGHEVVVDAVMLAGADGAVPGLGNVDPHGYARLAAACTGGNWVAARTEQDRLADLFTIVDVAPVATASRSAAGIGAFKTALMVRGVIATNMVSAPMRTLDETETDRIAAVLRRTGL